MTAKTREERDSWLAAFINARNSAENPDALKQTWQSEAEDCRKCIDVLADGEDGFEDDELSDSNEDGKSNSTRISDFVEISFFKIYFKIQIQFSIVDYHNVNRLTILLPSLFLLVDELDIYSIQVQLATGAGLSQTPAPTVMERKSSFARLFKSPA